MYRYVFPISSSTIFNHLCCGEYVAVNFGTSPRQVGWNKPKWGPQRRFCGRQVIGTSMWWKAMSLVLWTNLCSLEWLDVYGWNWATSGPRKLNLSSIYQFCSGMADIQTVHFWELIHWFWRKPRSEDGLVNRTQRLHSKTEDLERIYQEMDTSSTTNWVPLHSSPEDFKHLGVPKPGSVCKRHQAPTVDHGRSILLHQGMCFTVRSLMHVSAWYRSSWSAPRHEKSM